MATGRFPISQSGVRGGTAGMYVSRDHRQGSPGTSWLPAGPVSGSDRIRPRWVRGATGKGPLPQRDENANGQRGNPFGSLCFAGRGSTNARENSDGYRVPVRSRLHNYRELRASGIERIEFKCTSAVRRCANSSSSGCFLQHNCGQQYRRYDRIRSHCQPRLRDNPLCYCLARKSERRCCLSVF
jgi:hypothetical protein